MNVRKSIVSFDKLVRLLSETFGDLRKDGVIHHSVSVIPVEITMDDGAGSVIRTSLQIFLPNV
jgi:hypothetical protein